MTENTAPAEVNENTNLVGDLGLDKVPKGLPDHTYRGNIIDAKYNDSVNRGGDKGKGRAFIFKYKVNMPDGIQVGPDTINVDGMTQDHFLPANKDDDLFMRQNLVETLEAYNLNPTNITLADLNKLIGAPIWFKTKKSKDGRYINVVAVKLDDTAGGNPMTANGNGGNRDIDDF